MTIPRPELLIALGVVSLLGIGLISWRLIEARRSGLSFRLQVFLPLAATTLTLSAAFALIVIDRFTARASVFAQRGAQDEARVLAELASRALDAPGATLATAARQLESSRILQAFTHSEIATHVAIADVQGKTIVQVGELEPMSGVQIVTASAPIRDLGSVTVRKATFGMVQLMSDVAPKVALLALIFALASAALAVVIGQAVAGPIERLTRAAEHVAAGERQAALPEPRGKEVRALTHALESMRRELEERHSLENFVANLSHELKNPIASVRASAEVLTEGAADDPETARRFALRILESAEKLSALTQDLLSLARLEARGIEARPRKVDLCVIAREAVEAQAALAGARGVRVELRAPETAPLRGDPVWLRRAMENLLGNAVQHSPQGGKVLVEVAPGESGWEATVADEGPGVDPAIREKLFERFATTRHGEGGTGLGLAIVRAVAELHGGRAQLRRSSPQGTTFALSLPAR